MSSRNIKEVQSAGHGDKLNVGDEIGIEDLVWVNGAPTLNRKIREREGLGENLMCSVLYKRA